MYTDIYIDVYWLIYVLFVCRFSILVSVITIIVFQNMLSNIDQNKSSFTTFMNNSLGYCLILIPGYWLYKFAKQQDLGGEIICFNFTLRPNWINKSHNFKLLLNTEQITMLQVNY